MRVFSKLLAVVLGWHDQPERVWPVVMIKTQRPTWTILLACLTCACFAANKEVEDLLTQMRRAYSSVKSARLIVKTTSPRFGDQVLTTELSYARERKIHAKLSGLQTLNGRSIVFVSDGKKISVEDLAGNIKNADFDLDFIPVPVNLESMSFWDWKRQLSTAPGANMNKSSFKLRKNVSWNKKNWTVLEEKADGQGVSVDYFIDPKTAFIHRVMVYDYSKKTVSQETVITKLERDPKLNSNLFKIKVPSIKSESRVNS